MTPKSPIDTDALRAEIARLRQTPDVIAFHKAKATLGGASLLGTKRKKKKPCRQA